jgi:RNase P/RNase MRP subunit p30
MVEAAKSLGYSLVGVAGKTDLDVVTRLDLDPKNQNKLNQSLRSNRWRIEIIVVNCRNKSVARKAGQDRRVDLVTYPISDKWKRNYLDRQQAGLMRDSGSGYLVDVSKLLITDAFVLRKNIEYFKRNLEIAVKRGVPVVASSFATEPLKLRDPHGLAALLSLLDVDEDHALEMVSTNPYTMVMRNRIKLKNSYIQDGVLVIEDE